MSYIYTNKKGQKIKLTRGSDGKLRAYKKRFNHSNTIHKGLRNKRTGKFIRYGRISGFGHKRDDE